MIKKQFTLYLENRPGELARVTSVLAREKVNIEGISVSAGPDVGLVQLVADNAAVARKILARERVPFTVQDVAVVSLVNVPGALELVVSRLAAAGVNISYIYATACQCCPTTCSACDCKCSVVVSAPDLRKVEVVCRNLMKCCSGRTRKAKKC
jgi:hypothetical protein